MIIALAPKEIQEAATDPIGFVNRINHCFHISMASEVEISALTTDDKDLACLPSKGRLYDWHIFKIEFIYKDGVIIDLFTCGFMDNGQVPTSVWCTTRLQKITDDRRVIQTKNSIYHLGRPHEGEQPDGDIAMAFVRWLGTNFAKAEIIHIPDYS